MTKVLEPTTTPDAIVFELERFEPADGRLELSGRWFGVRGRRFVRPTLTAALESGRVRALADLDDKPWAAEDGEPWTASFPWDSNGRPDVSELSVAPDITIQLPAPRPRRGRAQRLPAVPRREAMTASWGDVVSSAETEPRKARPAPSAVPPESAKAEPGSPPRAAAESVATGAAPAPVSPNAELAALRAQLQEATESLTGSQAELETVRQELTALRSELEDARRQLSLRADGFEDAQAKLHSARTARAAALRSAAQAESEREVALSQAADAQAERDRLAAERDRLAADQVSLTATLAQVQASLEMLTNERDRAVASRGAALVMRGATRALPAHERHVGWARRGLVLLVLIGVVFAALIVLHAL